MFIMNNKLWSEICYVIPNTALQEIIRDKIRDCKQIFLSEFLIIIYDEWENFDNR